jgi:hypothetical protein
MITNFVPFATIWGLLALTTLFLIAYRRHVASREDYSLHLSGVGSANQMVVAHRLAVIDKCGKAVTAVTLFYGLALLALYFYNVWKDVPTY